MKMDWEPINMLTKPIPTESSTRTKVCNLNNAQLKTTGNESKKEYITEFEKFVFGKTAVKLSEIHNNFSHHKTMSDDPEDLQRTSQQNEMSHSEKSDTLPTGNVCNSNKDSDENQPPQQTLKPDILSHSATCNAKKILKVRIERLSSEKICEMHQSKENGTKIASTVETPLDKKCSKSKNIYTHKHSFLQNECEKSTPRADAPPPSESSHKVQHYINDKNITEPLNSLLKRLNIKPSFVLLKRLPFINNIDINKPYVFGSTKNDSLTSDKNTMSKDYNKTLSDCIKIKNKSDKRESILHSTNDCIDTKDETSIDASSSTTTDKKPKLTLGLQNRKIPVRQDILKKRKRKNIRDDSDISSQRNSSANSLQYGVSNRDDTVKPKQQLLKNRKKYFPSLSQTKNISLNRGPDKKINTLSSYSLRNSPKCKINQIQSAFDDGKKLKKINKRKYNLNTSNKKDKKCKVNNLILKESINQTKVMTKPLRRKSRSLVIKQTSSANNNVQLRNSPKIISVKRSIDDSACIKVKNVSNPLRKNNKRAPIVDMIQKISKKLYRHHLEEDKMITFEEQSNRNQQTNSTGIREEFNAESENHMQHSLSYNNTLSKCVNVYPPSPQILQIPSSQTTLKPFTIVQRLKPYKAAESYPRPESNILTANLKPKLDCSNQLKSHKPTIIWQTVSMNENTRNCIVIPSSEHPNSLQQPVKCAIYKKPTTFNYGRKLKYNLDGRCKTETVYQPYSLAALSLQTFFGCRISN